MDEHIFTEKDLTVEEHAEIERITACFGASAHAEARELITRMVLSRKNREARHRDLDRRLAGSHAFSTDIWPEEL